MDHLMFVVRGLLDGDGSVYTLIHAPTPRTYRQYRYERLSTFFNSASWRHVEWIQMRLAAALGIAGYIEKFERAGHENPMYRLKYGNVASRVLLPAIYEEQNLPRLERKWLKWARYARRHSIVVPTMAASP